jgi:hypothetical protein
MTVPALDASASVRLFGVVDADDAHPGAVPSGTALVSFRDLGAVVTPAEYVSVSVSDEMLTEYIRVVDTLYASGPIVPAPPGTVFKSVAMLTQWMELHYAKLHETLDLIARRASPNPPYDFVRMQFRD